MAEAVASASDAKPGEILTGGKAEQGSNSLIELERRNARAGGELRNAQGLVEMIVDIAKGR